MDRTQTVDENHVVVCLVIMFTPVDLFYHVIMFMVIKMSTMAIFYFLPMIANSESRLGWNIYAHLKEQDVNHSKYRILRGFFCWLNSFLYFYLQYLTISKS